MIKKEKILMVGGAKGVGKTSLIKESINKSGLIINYFNTGEIVNYFKKSHEEGKLINQSMIDMSIWYRLMSFEGVVDTHFAGKNIETGDYIMNLDYKLLLWASHHKDIQPILITADPEQVYERRKNDYQKKRIVDMNNILFEMEKNNYYFERYCLLIGKEQLIINNDDFETAKKDLTSIIIDTYNNND